jgi:hypothetical protein
MEVRSAQAWLPAAEFFVESEATQAATMALRPAWDSRATELVARDAAEPPVKPTGPELPSPPALESLPEKRTPLRTDLASA